jgi:hypothetical protein
MLPLGGVSIAGLRTRLGLGSITQFLTPGLWKKKLKLNGSIFLG